MTENENSEPITTAESKLRKPAKKAVAKKSLQKKILKVQSAGAISDVQNTIAKKIKRKTKKRASNKLPKRSRGYKLREFPLISFEECYNFTKSIYDLGSGQPVKRLTLFDKINKSPESSTSRILITNASKYGLINGNKQSEF